MKQAIQAPKGFLYLIRGFGIILSQWRLVRLAIMPLLVNIILFIIFFFSFNYFAYQISDWAFDQGQTAWYWYIISVVTGTALFVVSIFTVLFGFVAVGLIVAAPFNDMLSAAVEETVTGRLIESEMPFYQFVKFTALNETKKMAVFIFCELVLLLLNLIPVAGQMIYVILNFIFLIFVVVYEFTGYTLDRRGHKFAEKRRYITSNMGLSFGFGASIWITLAIPFVGFLLLPLAVAGGTLMAVENPPDTTGR